jgi:hypothetical protein
MTIRTSNTVIKYCIKSLIKSIIISIKSPTTLISLNINIINITYIIVMLYIGISILSNMNHYTYI